MGYRSFTNSTLLLELIRNFVNPSDNKSHSLFGKMHFAIISISERPNLLNHILQKTLWQKYVSDLFS